MAIIAMLQQVHAQDGLHTMCTGNLQISFLDGLSQLPSTNFEQLYLPTIGGGLGFSLMYHSLSAGLQVSYGGNRKGMDKWYGKKDDVAAWLNIGYEVIKSERWSFVPSVGFGIAESDYYYVKEDYMAAVSSNNYIVPLTATLWHTTKGHTFGLFLQYIFSSPIEKTTITGTNKPGGDFVLTPGTISIGTVFKL